MSALNEKEILEIKNVADCQAILLQMQHPHPMTIVLIIIMTVLVMYCLFVKRFKKSAGGHWTNSDDVHFDIKHNKWKDTIVVGGKYPGLVKGNLVIVHMDDIVQMGIWFDDKIKWMNGSVWYR